MDDFYHRFHDKSKMTQFIHLIFFLLWWLPSGATRSTGCGGRGSTPHRTSLTSVVQVVGGFKRNWGVLTRIRGRDEDLRHPWGHGAALLLLQQQRVLPPVPAAVQRTVCHPHRTHWWCQALWPRAGLSAGLTNIFCQRKYFPKRKTAGSCRLGSVQQLFSEGGGRDLCLQEEVVLM